MCIPRFENKGYSTDFCRNMQKIKELIKTEKYELTDKCDDICACCANSINGICKDEKKVARYDAAVKKALESGIKPLPENICTDCKWYYICSKYSDI